MRVAHARHAAERYGALTRRLDLSSNCITTLGSLHPFAGLVELVRGSPALRSPPRLPLSLPHFPPPLPLC